MNKLYRSILVSGVCTTALLSGSAFAEAAKQSIAGLEEITVTAQKRTERLENVPISITAVSAAKLESAGVTSFAELGQISVGTQVAQVGIFLQPSIRGVTTQLIGIGQENNVATYVDGFYMPNQVGLNFDLSSIENIEVLKGPQGTLFGRNATGGAILIKTRDPGNTPEESFSVSYGRFNDARIQAYVSLPVNDKVAFNVAGYFRNSDGYIHDISGRNTAPIEQRAVRTKLRIQASDKFKILFGFNYGRVSDATGVALTFFANQGALFFFPGETAATGKNQTSMNYNPTTETKVYDGNITAEYDFGGVKLTSLTRYMDEKELINFDVDGTTAPFYAQEVHQTDKSFSQEFNLNSTGNSRLDWVLGAFYFSNVVGQPFNKVNNSGVSLISSMDSKAYALFADATLPIGDKLFLTGGARYSWETKKSPLLHPEDVIVSDVPKKTWKSFTPRATIRYQITDSTNVYGSFSKGFKSGSFNATGTDPNAVNPEKITAYEIGLKTAQSNFRFDLAGYYYDYTDLQVGLVIQSPSGGLSTGTANAAKAKIYGGEAQITYNPVNELALNAGVAYTHARYTSYPAASAVDIVGPFYATASQDWKDRQIVRAPDWTLNFGYNYHHPVGNGSVELAGNVAYSSSYQPGTDSLTPAGDYAFPQHSFALVNMSGTWHAPGDHLSLTVYGKNITNAGYRILYNAYPFFGAHQLYGEPVTYGVRASYNF